MKLLRNWKGKMRNRGNKFFVSPNYDPFRKMQKIMKLDYEKYVVKR